MALSEDDQKVNHSLDDIFKPNMSGRDHPLRSNSRISMTTLIFGLINTRVVVS